MATFQWQFDAPTGTFKNHAMSRRLFEAAMEEVVFMEHVRPIDGFGKRRGETVTLTRLSRTAEPTSADLTEGIRISEDELTLTTTSITVTEMGRAIPYTSLADDLSMFDLSNPIQRELVDQWRLVLDTKVATAYKQAKVKYIPTGVAARIIDTDGTPSTTATANLNVFHVEEIRDYMFDTLHVPTLDNDDYQAIFRTKGLRGLKRDPTWEEWHKYTDPQAKFNNEIGRIEQVRFQETNHANALGLKGSGSILGEGIVFGRDSVVVAEAEAPELRAALPDDFGRKRAVAWYAILEFGLIWDTANANEARVVHVTSQ